MVEFPITYNFIKGTSTINHLVEPREASGIVLPIGYSTLLAAGRSVEFNDFVTVYSVSDMLVHARDFKLSLAKRDVLKEVLEKHHVSDRNFYPLGFSVDGDQIAFSQGKNQNIFIIPKFGDPVVKLPLNLYLLLGHYLSGSEIELVNGGLYIKPFKKREVHFFYKNSSSFLFFKKVCDFFCETIKTNPHTKENSLVFFDTDNGFQIQISYSEEDLITEVALEIIHKENELIKNLIGLIQDRVYFDQYFC
ncbi:hypothetical protein [Acanthopleuribacter pedis]|uniref:Uncharacterized protein n=1 Tax=Acanthopleuribacter pedis TaxID=442870 RepID=A0A8J7QV76_9BACT|nr:hypothetical protein [Acanthopleuribacter pedis]MBO1323468.1 hypothetical protein [Acanthopleuribacter pedis]